MTRYLKHIWIRSRAAVSAAKRINHLSCTAYSMYIVHHAAGEVHGTGGEHGAEGEAGEPGGGHPGPTGHTRHILYNHR